MHLHGKHAISVSKKLTPSNILTWAKIKGVDVIGTGDFLHEQWRNEFLPYIDEKTVVPTTEISLHFNYKNRKAAIHLALVFSNIDGGICVAESLISFAPVERLARPDIFMTPDEFCQRIWECDEKCAIIPAHIFTPYFGALGARGLDDLEIFKGCLKAVETGISADIEMCSSVKALDNFAFVSFSDAHGLQTIGRESTIIRIGNVSEEITKPVATIECHPELGKYHLTGHRKCSFSTEEAVPGLICPVCGKKMARGVAERLGYFKRSDRTPPESIKIVPLLDILMNSCGTNSKTSRQEKLFLKAVEVIGNEYYILLQAGADELAKCFDDSTITLILAARSSDVAITPGYDGEYGRLSKSNC